MLFRDPSSAFLLIFSWPWALTGLLPMSQIYHPPGTKKIKARIDHSRAYDIQQGTLYYISSQKRPQANYGTNRLHILPQKFERNWHDRYPGTSRASASILIQMRSGENRGREWAQLFFAQHGMISVIYTKVPRMQRPMGTKLDGGSYIHGLC